MLVQFGNNWIQKIPLTAKLDSAYGLIQFWLSSEFFSSNYFQIGQHVVLLHIQIMEIKNNDLICCLSCKNISKFALSGRFSKLYERPGYLFCIRETPV